ncbi:hypothetical protein HU200_011871 [Digitaria exilis]|uniref:Uncharacterized protein n=1 Tax=Digitaria exilis TaxID=1010633 RepID=A0A835FHD8_9POAL|nr:hypothetical protein HU200_011871 [Digitaria exilis]
MSISNRISPSRSSTTSMLIYGPRSFEDDFKHQKKDEVQAVVAKIEKTYRRAGLSKVKMDSGYCCCLGLLDPISNIRVNGCI